MFLGTGVIIYQDDEMYSVLTNWHVIGTEHRLQVTTADGKTHLLHSPQQLGNVDLAIAQFDSDDTYQVATVATEASQVGEKVYTAGFPLYDREITSDKIDRGADSFRLIQGEISLIPPQSLPKGYHLGYTDETEMGMSDGPIFNTRFLIGIHGRGKYRDPSFGVYTFASGSRTKPLNARNYD